eukprot:Seg6169.2 transcript_id=Seg6169.2/GoldUCD/mRNA.D3Y31 product="hypothetical protein" protein_id=Seg6169.2/GoldUCD/D3Y31
MVICAFVGCCTNRNSVSETYKGISLFKVTNRKGEYYENWRKEVVNILTKFRVIDASLKHQIETNTVCICERHYKPEDIEISTKGRKILCPGALPTENHPNKSHQSVVNVTRRHVDIVQDHPIQEKITYQSIEQLKRGI